MVDFSVSSARLSVRPLVPADVPPIARMGRGPNLDYFAYAPGPREAGGRAATVGAAAALFRQGSELLNEYSLTYALRTWLKNNDQPISQAMDAKGHTVFVMQVTYSLAQGADTRAFMWRSAYFLESARSRAELEPTLARLVQGPWIGPTPPNRSISYVTVYLLGERISH
ncbi:hypothetical protein RNI52_03285 [Labrys neptuniae]|uniref:hypothetical protein n=1 Tax=Labrys neptuniae TaxID=376174 RepID=UPI0028900A7D|nr:hypothetical protein [Labrys neptuniae]MDT3376342.1 hypothetical protein [Labrys neptuniae]